MKVNTQYLKKIVMGDMHCVVMSKGGFHIGAFSSKSEIYHIMYVLLLVCK